jgi:endonuclease YncB( thermonuclease family)
MGKRGTKYVSSLVKRGVKVTIPPNVKYQDRFLKAYLKAKERKRGLW